jgi:hypothetical protein
MAILTTSSIFKPIPQSTTPTPDNTQANGSSPSCAYSLSPFATLLLKNTAVCFTGELLSPLAASHTHTISTHRSSKRRTPQVRCSTTSHSQTSYSSRPFTSTCKPEERRNSAEYKPCAIFQCAIAYAWKHPIVPGSGGLDTTESRP